MADLSRDVVGTIAVEFDPDLLALLERRAGKAGVTIEEYVREAARAYAADPTAAEQAPDWEVATPSRSERLLAGEPTEHSNGHRAHAGAESNLAYVGRLWEAFRTGGAAKMAELVPDGVKWRPLAGDGRVLGDMDELHDFWASRPVQPATPGMFYEYDDDVLVRSELAVPDAAVKEIWSLYRFDGDTLTEAVSFGSEGEARDYAAERRTQ